MKITPDTLYPICQQTWATTVPALPAGHANRWKVNRMVQPHGTRRSVLLWRVWDARCTAHGLNPWYFCWCFNYDPEHYYNRETHWQLHLYLNTIRQYRHAETVCHVLRKRLPEVCPEGFQYVRDDHSVQLAWDFRHPGRMEELPPRVAPMLVRGLVATAPVFDEVFALLANGLPAGETGAERKPARPAANPAAAGHGGALSRNLRPAVRQQVLAAHGPTCAICGQGIETGEEVHIDHTMPWSAGGASHPDNLRPAHARCNLAKGGRPPARKGVRPAARRL